MWGLYMRPGGQQVLLCIGGCHRPMADQPSQRDGGGAGTAGFAVNVNRFAPLDMLLNECHRGVDVVGGGMSEIGRRNVQLGDAGSAILSHRPGVFRTRVDHAANTLGGHRFDIPGQTDRRLR